MMRWKGLAFRPFFFSFPFSFPSTSSSPDSPLLFSSSSNSFSPPPFPLSSLSTFSRASFSTLPLLARSPASPFFSSPLFSSATTRLSSPSHFLPTKITSFLAYGGASPFYPASHFSSSTTHKGKSKESTPTGRVDTRSLHPKKRKKYSVVGRGNRRSAKIEERRLAREERKVNRAKERFQDEANTYRRAELYIKFEKAYGTAASLNPNSTLSDYELPSWSKLQQIKAELSRKKLALQQQTGFDPNGSDQENDSDQEYDDDDDDDDDEEEGEDEDGDDIDDKHHGDNEEGIFEQEKDIGEEFDGGLGRFEKYEAMLNALDTNFQSWDQVSGERRKKEKTAAMVENENLDLLLEMKRVYLIDPFVVEDNKGLLRKKQNQVIFDETQRLVEATGWDLVKSEKVIVRKAHNKWFFGSGKTGEISEKVAQLIEESPTPLIVVVNATLPGGTLNRLEKRFAGTTVLDRVGLILEIFKRRAHHRESKLLVELAAHGYERARLVGSREGLDRQRGGGRSMSGAGETKFETDRRAIDRRIDFLNKQLLKIEKRRSRQRLDRRKRFPVVALVGYTNVGKSALLNRLTGARVFSEDMLFASLDTFARPLHFPSGQTAIMVDTIGFISDLPDALVPAFRATLEEVRHAHLIIHVRDISNPFHSWQAKKVEEFLASMEITDVPILNVYNKIDFLSPQVNNLEEFDSIPFVNSPLDSSFSQFESPIDEMIDATQKNQKDDEEDGEDDEEHDHAGHKLQEFDENFVEHLDKEKHKQDGEELEEVELKFSDDEEEPKLLVGKRRSKKPSGIFRFSKKDRPHLEASDDEDVKSAEDDLLRAFGRKPSSSKRRVSLLQEAPPVDSAQQPNPDSQEPVIQLTEVEEPLGAELEGDIFEGADDDVNDEDDDNFSLADLGKINPEFLKVSAETGEGCPQLAGDIEQRLLPFFLFKINQVRISVHHSQLLSFCYKNGKVKDKQYDHDTDEWCLSVLFPPGVHEKFLKLTKQQVFQDYIENKK